MKVKFLQPGAKFQLAYFVGDVAELEDKQAEQLIEAKVCEPLEESEPKKKKGK